MNTFRLDGPEAKRRGTEHIPLGKPEAERRGTEHIPLGKPEAERRVAGQSLPQRRPAYTIGYL